MSAESKLAEQKKIYTEMVETLDSLPEKRNTRNDYPTYTPKPNNGKPSGKNNKDSLQNKTVNKTPTTPQITGITIDQLQTMINSAVNPIVTSIEKLTASNDELRKTIALQGEEIKSIKTKSDENRKDIGINHENIGKVGERTAENESDIRDLMNTNCDLRNEVDDLRQSLLDTSVILSGPLIHDFVTSNTEIGSFTRYHGHPAIDTLSWKLSPPMNRLHSQTQHTEDSTEATEQRLPSQNGAPMVAESSNSVTKTSPAVTVATPNFKIESIRKLRNNRISVKMATRDQVHLLFQRSKETNRQFFVAEQLTPTRQHVMFLLRNYFKDKPNTQVSLFTKNGVPMAKIGTGAPVPLKTEWQARNYIRELDRGL